MTVFQPPSMEHCVSNCCLYFWIKYVDFLEELELETIPDLKVGNEDTSDTNEGYQKMVCNCLNLHFLILFSLMISHRTMVTTFQATICSQ